MLMEGEELREDGEGQKKTRREGDNEEDEMGEDRERQEGRELVVERGMEGDNDND